MKSLAIAQLLAWKGPRNRTYLNLVAKALLEFKVDLLKARVGEKAESHLIYADHALDEVIKRLDIAFNVDFVEKHEAAKRLEKSS